MPQVFRGMASVDGTLGAGLLRIGDDAHPLPCKEESFHLMVDDMPMNIRVGPQTVFGPAKETEGPWEELKDHPLLESFAKRPGGHVEVSLSAAMFVHRDKIVVAGEPYPDPSTGLKSVTASWIGVGPKGAQWVNEQLHSEEPEVDKPSKEGESAQPIPGPPKATELSLGASQLLAIIGAGLVGAAFALREAGSALSPVAWFVGMVGLSVAIFSWRRRRFLYRMLEPHASTPVPPQQVGPRSSFKLTWSSGGAGTTLALAACVLALGPAFVAVLHREPWTIAVLAFGPALVLLTQAAVIYWENLEHTHRMAILLRGKPAQGDGWGVRVGFVEAGQLSRRREHTKHTITESEQYTDDNGRVETRKTDRTWYHGVEFDGAGRLTLKLPDDKIEVVVSDKALWGTARRGIHQLTLSEEIRKGDQVAVLSRLDGGVAKSTGAESLVLFAAQSDALGTLRRALLMHRLTLLLFVLLAASTALYWVSL